MLTIFGQFLQPGRRGSVDIFFGNLLKGFSAIGAEVVVEPSASTRFGGRFMAEQSDILGLGPGPVLLPDYFTPPIIPKGVRTVAVIHDLRFRRFPWSMPASKVAWLNAAVPLTLARADRVIVTSDFTKSELMDCYPTLTRRCDIRVIPEPLDMTRFVSDAPTPYNPLAPSVLCPVSGAGHENLKFFFRLFEQRRELAEFKLVVVGAKPVEIPWPRSTSGRYGDRMRFINIAQFGVVPDEFLGVLHRQADVVIFPSVYEGFGRPIFEALSLGAPVVCTSTGAVREMGETPALVVQDPNDEDEWVEAILKQRRVRRPGWQALPQFPELDPATVAARYLDACTF